MARLGPSRAHPPHSVTAGWHPRSREYAPAVKNDEKTMTERPVASLAMAGDVHRTYELAHLRDVVRRNPTGPRRPVALGRYDPPMTHHAQSLLRAALSLSGQERADLAAELLVSLEGPPEGDDATVEQAWADELERRARRVLAGESHGEDWDQLRDRVRSALTDG